MFWANDGLDTRLILLQKETDVDISDTVDSLYSRFLYPEGIQAMVLILCRYLNHRYIPDISYVGLCVNEIHSTVLNLILHMEKIISILKNVRFSGKGRQSLHVVRICKMLISYIKLDHTLYLINYGNREEMETGRGGAGGGG